MGQVEVVLASEPYQYELCLQIRRAVFVEEQGVPEETEIDEYENISKHFLALRAGVPVGTGRLRLKESFAKFERIASLKGCRGLGVGRRLMEAMQEYALRHFPESLPAMHAQEHAVGFYVKLGWVPLGEEFLEAEIPHRVLIYPPKDCYRLARLRIWQEPEAREDIRNHLRPFLTSPLPLVPAPDSIIFDLDGTLWDTCASCAKAWNNVLRRRGIEFRPIVPEDVRRVAGKPHELCIRETFAGLTEYDLEILIEDTTEEDNAVLSTSGGELYPGVLSGLQELRNKYPLFIVSNCQAGYIETFLKFHGLSDHFVDYECWGNTGKSKSENLADLIARNGLKRPVFVGDAESDRLAARACSIPFYFAEYGFGEVQGCDMTISSFPHLARIL
ncbi:MAG: GNAT family N-acetyltransferase [Bdellovibrionales bacterium]